MGWPIFIGEYYSLTLIGIIFGLAYPFYVAFFSKASKSGNVPSEARTISVLVAASISNAFRFGFYAFIVLTLLAIFIGIGFSLWALFSEFNS